MPQAADQKHDDGVEIGPGLSLPAAAQGKIDVPGQKSRQAHMPAFPEIPDGQRLVGGIEVHGQIDVQHSGKAQCHIAVAAEIEIDLEGVGQHHKKQFQGACLLHGQEHRRGGKGICQHSLLEQAEGELPHPGAERLLPETQTALLVKLGNEILRRCNGAHDELGKVDHIQHIVQKAVPFPLTPGSIHQIGNLLEGKEADAQRKGDL